MVQPWLRFHIPLRLESVYAPSGSQKDLADTLLVLPSYANRDQQPFSAGFQHEIAETFLCRSEAMSLLAALQDKAFEVAEAVKITSQTFPVLQMCFPSGGRPGKPGSSGDGSIRVGSTPNPLTWSPSWLM